MKLYLEYLQEVENDLRIEAEIEAEVERIAWEDEIREALIKAADMGDEDLYSDLYKDLYGIRPKW